MVYQISVVSNLLDQIRISLKRERSHNLRNQSAISQITWRQKKIVRFYATDSKYISYKNILVFPQMPNAQIIISSNVIIIIFLAFALILVRQANSKHYIVKVHYSSISEILDIINLLLLILLFGSRHNKESQVS